MQAVLDQRRIQRLKEVRQQEKEVALQIRQAVKQRRAKHTKKLKTHLQAQFEEDKENQVT